MGNVPTGTVYIWKYLSSRMCWSYANDLQSNNHCLAQIQFREEVLQGICWLHWFNSEVVQSTLQMLNYPCFHLLDHWLRLFKVMCWLKWMPWIPLFWVLAMLVVQSCCFAICFPNSIFHSNYVPMSRCRCWIWGTCQIRLWEFYHPFIRSIFGWWCTRDIVYG